MNKKALCLILPLAVLIGWTGILTYRQTHGALIEVAVQGYDPRDLLAGHYLRIRTDYGVKCPEKRWGEAFLCADGGSVTLEPEEKTENCPVRIRGWCRGTRFDDGIQRFYVSEGKARLLEAALRDGKVKTTLVLSVSGNSNIPVPVDLKLDGISWKDWTPPENQDQASDTPR